MICQKQIKERRLNVKVKSKVKVIFFIIISFLFHLFGVRKMASKTAGSSLWLQTLSQWSCPWTPGENKFLSFSENCQKKLDDVGQCREGKWEQSTVTILSMWTNNAWLNRTSISQTWSSASILGWHEIIKSWPWQINCVSHVPLLNCQHHGYLMSRLGSLTILALNNLMMMMMMMMILTILWWWS